MVPYPLFKKIIIILGYIDVTVLTLPCMRDDSRHKRFELLYQKYGEEMYRYAFFHLGNKEAAEDIVQEVFTKFWDRIDGVVEGKEQFYLFRSAKNLLITKGKKKKVVEKFVNQLKWKSEFRDPQFLMEESEFKSKIERMLASLTDAQREVFLMSRIEGLKYKEIAHKLGLSQKAVEKRMSQALLKMRETYRKI